MLQFLLSITDESNHEKIMYLYNKYHDPMINYAVSKFKNMNRCNYVYDAEDAVQSAFVKITKHIDNINFSLEERIVKNYVYAILNNEICDLLRNNVEFLEFDETLYDETAYNFVEDFDIKQRYKEVVSAIENLDPKYSTTLTLLYCQELTVNEISATMGISAKTVYTRVCRGRKLLIEALGVATSDE